ncbi:MAG: thioesterase family protein [Bacteroidetes bacterium]|nr:thioesterase family protein [Bacteroidota bacterium]MDA1333157.1 thioesterase family protein [Bacteroidota bacterium]
MTSNQFSWTFTVGRESIDVNGHVNNVEYVRWMQEVAMRHTTNVGADIRTAAAGLIWVVRSHEIEYRLPAHEGDEVRITTWIESVERVSSCRRYDFRRTKDDAVIASGKTKWVCLNRKTGRPAAIPEHLIAMYFDDSTTDQ